jgi:hypothetical protein
MANDPMATFSASSQVFADGADKIAHALDLLLNQGLRQLGQHAIYLKLIY